MKASELRVGDIYRSNKPTLDGRKVLAIGETFVNASGYDRIPVTLESRDGNDGIIFLTPEFECRIDTREADRMNDLHKGWAITRQAPRDGGHFLVLRPDGSKYGQTQTEAGARIMRRRAIETTASGSTYNPTADAVHGNPEFAGAVYEGLAAASADGADFNRGYLCAAADVIADLAHR